MICIEDQSYVFSVFCTYLQLFQDQSESNGGSVQKVAESILCFFSGFDAFQLPPPSSDREVLENIASNKDKLTSAFLEGVEKFKSSLQSILVTKQSVNDGDIVTGEGMYEIFRVGNDLFISACVVSWKPLDQIEVTRYHKQSGMHLDENLIKELFLSLTAIPRLQLSSKFFGLRDVSSFSISTKPIS